MSNAHMLLRRHRKFMYAVQFLSQRRPRRLRAHLLILQQPRPQQRPASNTNPTKCHDITHTHTHVTSLHVSTMLAKIQRMSKHRMYSGQGSVPLPKPAPSHRHPSAPHSSYFKRAQETKYPLRSWSPYNILFPHINYSQNACHEIFDTPAGDSSSSNSRCSQPPQAQPSKNAAQQCLSPNHHLGAF